MSSPEPVGYQSIAIEKLSTSLTALMTVDQSKDRLIVFKAPTGAGKTLMVGSALASAYDKPSERKFIVLWLSPGKGNLHKQSAKSLSSLLKGTSLKVHLLDSQDDIVKYQDPASGSVFVVNWEKLRTEKDGQWANKMLAEGENANFFTLLTRATAKGLDMVAVIDESHTNLGGEQTNKLMQAVRSMRPFIQLELSATPTVKPDPDLVEEGVHRYVRVKFEDVEAEGMIRKNVILNDHFSEVQESHLSESISAQVLWAAWEKIESLSAAYTAAGSTVKPLLLIQYPDGDEAAARALVVEEFLEQRGLIKGQTYAIWLSGEHSEGLELISANSSPYRALIFKQAIATGWDCPRAQVLVQFRDPKSPVFQIQTLGRILRSPEQKHYDNDALNVAYVFSDLEGVDVNVRTDEPDVQVRDRTLVRGPNYPAQNLALHSVFQPRAREFHYPMIENLSPALNAALDGSLTELLPDDPFTSTPVTITTDARVSTRELDAGVERSLTGGNATGNLDDMLVQALYDLLLVASIGQYRSRTQSLSRIKRVITLWFKKHRPSWSTDEIQHFALRHQGIFISAIDEACESSMAAELSSAIVEARGKRRSKDNWEVPQTELVASNDYELSAAGNVLEPGLVWRGRSIPERNFEEFLAQQVELGTVNWWWKNGKSDEKYLGLEYTMLVPDIASTKIDGQNMALIEEDHITYPDYLVHCPNNTVWALEVKGIGDLQGDRDGATHCKAKGIARWISNMAELRKKNQEFLSHASVRGGVVVVAELSPGVFSVKLGDIDNWHKPEAAVFSAGTGWSPLDLKN